MNLKSAVIALVLLLNLALINFAQANSDPQFRQVTSDFRDLAPGEKFQYSIKIFTQSGISKFEYKVNFGGSMTIWPSTIVELKGTKTEKEYVLTVMVPKNTKLGTYKGWIVAYSKSGGYQEIPPYSFKIIDAKVSTSIKAKSNLDGTKIVEIKRSCDETKGECPELSDNQNQLQIEKCRIEDQSKDFKVSNGFPRPSDAIQGAKKATVLFMVFEFADKKFPDKAYEYAKVEAKLTRNFYKRVSYGLVDVNYVFPEKKDWVRFPEKNSYYLSQIDSADTFINLVLDQGAYLKPQDYDGVIIATPDNLEKVNMDSYRNIEIQSKGEKISRVYWAGGNALDFYGTYNNIGHGIGHLLFLLEDIYHLGENRKITQPSGRWDVMGGGSEFFAWSMYLNGWLSDDQIYCLKPGLQDSTLLLSPISIKGGKKLVAISPGLGQLLMVEYRTGRLDRDLLTDGRCDLEFCDSNLREGLVIYYLDTRISHLKGPIRVPKRFYSKPMVLGENILYRGFKIEFLAKGRDGAYVRVGRS